MGYCAICVLYLWTQPADMVYSCIFVTQITNIFGGLNDCIWLLYLTTKHVFANTEGAISRLPPGCGPECISLKRPLIPKIVHYADLSFQNWTSRRKSLIPILTSIILFRDLDLSLDRPRCDIADIFCVIHHLQRMLHFAKFWKAGARSHRCIWCLSGRYTPFE